MITTIPTNTPEISTVDALWTIIQNQSKAVRTALKKRIMAEHIGEESEKAKQQAMVKDSLTRAFDELHSGKVHHDARNLFKR